MLHYEPTTGEWTWLRPCSRNIHVGDKAGKTKKYGYNKIQIWGTSYQASRLAFLYMIGRWPADQIDHKNRDKEDDRWDNLREATQSENNYNRSDSIRGVYFFNNKWKARIAQRHLGTFDTIELAMAARDEAARIVAGEFAILNRDLV
jgi:hypothetical protein